VGHAVVGDRIAPVPQDAPAYRRAMGFRAAGIDASWPETHLMSQRDLAPIACRFEGSPADLERRHRPPAVVERRPAMHDRVVELVDDFGARNRAGLASGSGRASPSP
jgi:hypothetical protein